MRKKKSILIIFMFAVLVLSSYGTTWTVSSVSSAITYTYTSQTSYKSFTVTRSDRTGKAYYYLLVSGAALGSSATGARKVYLNGNENDSSIQIFLRPSSDTTEIGTDNISGATVISGSMSSGSKTGTLNFRVVTASGSVPDGSYTNVFTFQLYTGSQTPPGGTAQSGVVGTLTVTITVSQGRTVSLSVSPANCSFGSALSEGNTYSVGATLWVTAPANYTISVFSTYGGKLYLSADDTIAYYFYFNGSATATDLSHGSVELVTSSTTATNKSYSLNFTTVPIGFITPGLYNDILTFTFTTG